MADSEKRENGGGLAAAAGAVLNAPGSGRFMAGGTALTPMQAAFVSAYVRNGGMQTEAARAAGYSEPRQTAWALLKNRAILAAIHEETVARVVTGGAIGVGVLAQIAQDAAAPAAARVTAAKWLAEAAGHGLAARRAGEIAADDKPLEQMTAGELEQAARDIADQLARARLGFVEGEVVPAGDARDDARSPVAGGAES